MFSQPWSTGLSPVYSWVLIIVSYVTFDHVCMVYYVAWWRLPTPILLCNLMLYKDKEITLNLDDQTRHN